MGKKKEVSLPEDEEDIVEFYEGSGKFTLPNGDYYEGQYTAYYKGLIWREGFGKYITQDGQVYEGLWKDDKLVDKSDVIIEYPNGCKYEGQLIKNKYTGSGKLEFVKGMSLLANFNENKVEGDVMLVDPHGKLWKGYANQEKAYLVPENIFFNNIDENRGKCRSTFSPVLQEILSESKPQPSREESTEVSNQPLSLSSQVFKKNTKIDATIDFDDSKWMQSFLKYRETRKVVLNKIQNHIKLTREEMVWYKKYIACKNLAKKRKTEAAIMRASKVVDISQLERFYSDEYKESSKPYKVYYPTYDWHVHKEVESKLTSPDLSDVQIHEEDSYMGSINSSLYNVPSDTDIVLPVEPVSKQSVPADTSSMYKYLNTVLGENAIKYCSAKTIC